MRAFLTGRVELIERIADKLTDSDPNNTAQLEAIWEDEKDHLLTASLDTVIRIIEEEVDDPATAAFIIELIKTLKGGI